MGGRTYDVSSVKDVTRKFHVVVVQQQRQRNVQKSVLHVQSCFLLIKPTVVVVVAVGFSLPFSMPSPFSITRFYFCLSKLYVL